MVKPQNERTTWPDNTSQCAQRSYLQSASSAVTLLALSLLLRLSEHPQKKSGKLGRSFDLFRRTYRKNTSSCPADYGIAHAYMKSRRELQYFLAAAMYRSLMAQSGTLRPAI